MARIINAQYSTLIGTPQELRQFVELMSGERAAVVDLRFSNFVVLGKPITRDQIQQALATTPQTRKGGRT